MEMRK